MGGRSVRVLADGRGLTQQAKLLADDGDSDDNFGSSVALAGDTALVGAQGDEDPNGEAAGAAYVYHSEQSGDETTTADETDGSTTTDELGQGNGNESEADESDGGQAMPGFGIGSATAALGGGLLWRRLRTDDEEA
jgi:hypothetical protein